MPGIPLSVKNNNNNKPNDIPTSRNRRPPSSILKFEFILDKVGDDNRHQKLLLYCFLLPLAFYIPFGSSSLLLMLSTPEHLCKVPARELLNVSRSLWRRVTIPWEPGSDGSRGHYSRCLMRNVTFSEEDDETGLSHVHIDPDTNTTCQYGWEYDQRWWDATATSEHDWVCDKAFVVPLLLSLAVISNAFGTLLMNLLAERLGKRPVFFLCVLISSVFGIVNLFCSTWEMFAVTKFLSSFSYFSMYQLPYILVIEQSCGKVRGMAAALCAIAITCGMGALSLVAWLTKNWRTFGLVCYLPGFLFLLYWKLLPESPSWLLSKGRLEECSSVLHLIADRNGRYDPPELMKVLFELRKEERRSKPVAMSDLVKVSSLRKRIVIVVIKTAILCIVYSGIVFNIRNISGNEFINFFALSLVDIPGNLLGMVSARFLGRRLTTIYTQLMAAGFCFFASVSTSNQATLTVLCCLGKLFMTSTVVVVFMQVGELFPTNLRTAAYGISGFLGLASSIAMPPLMSLGVFYPQIPYCILGLLCLVGATISSLLPETLGRSLPQTLEEANSIGYGHRFCSCVHHWNVHKVNRNEDDVCDGDITSRSFVSDDNYVSQC